MGGSPGTLILQWKLSWSFPRTNLHICDDIESEVFHPMFDIALISSHFSTLQSTTSLNLNIRNSGTRSRNPLNGRSGTLPRPPSSLVTHSRPPHKNKLSRTCRCSLLCNRFGQARPHETCSIGRSLRGLAGIVNPGRLNHLNFVLKVCPRHTTPTTDERAKKKSFSPRSFFFSEMKENEEKDEMRNLVRGFVMSGEW